jgi:cytosine/adenosine deaminase-related metal-dependent hydrolase
LLIKHATVLVTMDDEGTELADAGLYAVDGWIQQVGPTVELPEAADEVLDLSDHIVLPGLINTHHHFYQTLTRAIPGAQDAALFDWLRRLYPIWARMTPEDVVLSTQVALGELALSGCTTSSDHLYLYPNGSTFDDQVAAAASIPLRLHLARGSMSLGESDGGLPPDSVVDDEDVILADTARVIETFHDPEPGAMVRVVVAPCSPFSVTPDLMREAAALARAHGVHMHTHVAETRDEEQFCLETFGMRPVELMEDLGWAGDDVWYAHGVFVDGAEIERMASAGTGVAHCATSNMRLASGIAPLREYLEAGVRTGLGVDGSASNDGSHLLGEARQAMLLARLAAAGEEGPFFSAREALRLATRGSAAVLGRDDVGSLEAGKAADFTAISLDRIGYAGALDDPVAAVLFAAPVGVDHTYVQGRAVVSDGELVDVDLPVLLEAHNAASRRLLAG